VIEVESQISLQLPSKECLEAANLSTRAKDKRWNRKLKVFFWYFSEKAKSRTDKKRSRNCKRVSGELMEGVVTTK
jgi:hypothetical protein